MSNEELRNAKKILKQLKSEGLERYDVTDEAINIIKQYNEYADFIDEDMLDDMTLREAESGGFQRVKCFLEDADINCPYGWRIDGYGNATNVEFSDIIMYLEEIIENN